MKISFATDYFIPVYPLAPNKSFADIYNHCYAAYQEILQHYDPEDVILLGDSAGGTLVLNVLQNLATDFPERLPKSCCFNFSLVRWTFRHSCCQKLSKGQNDWHELFTINCPRD